MLLRVLFLRARPEKFALMAQVATALLTASVTEEESDVQFVVALYLQNGQLDALLKVLTAAIRGTTMASGTLGGNISSYGSHPQGSSLAGKVSGAGATLGMFLVAQTAMLMARFQMDETALTPFLQLHGRQLVLGAPITKTVIQTLEAFGCSVSLAALYEAQIEVPNATEALVNLMLAHPALPALCQPDRFIQCLIRRCTPELLNRTIQFYLSYYPLHLNDLLIQLRDHRIPAVLEMDANVSTTLSPHLPLIRSYLHSTLETAGLSNGNPPFYALRPACFQVLLLL
jgi:hypothetical protein